MSFDVTQNGPIDGQVVVGGQWSKDMPEMLMSMDICEVTGNIAMVLLNDSGKLIVFDSSGNHVESIASSHDVFAALDTDWDGGIWAVEYVLIPTRLRLGSGLL